MSFGEHVIHLNDGREMPLLGLGVYKATDDLELKQAISDAVSSGYRLIDTASFYKNEEGVGKGIQALDLPRENLFVTTKIWNTAQRIGDIEDSFNRSLERLSLEYSSLKQFRQSLWLTDIFLSTCYIFYIGYIDLY